MVGRKKDIPYQLLGWHEHVAFTRDKFPNLSYKEALSKASQTYHGKSGAGAKKKVVKRGKGIIGDIGNALDPILTPLLGLGAMEDPHLIAGLKKLMKKKAGASAHEIAGKKRVVKKRKPVAKKSAVKKRRVVKRK